MEYLTIEQLADRWHVCVMTIRRKVYANQIPFSRLGRKLLFNVTDIEIYEKSKSVNVLR